MVEIKHRADEGYQGEDDNHASYYLINNKDAIGIKLAPYLVDEPSEPKPPQQGSEDDAQIAHAHLKRHVGHHEGKLGEGGHEEEHDERIAQRHQECRDAIVPERALLVAALVHVLGGIALEAIDAKHQQQDAAKYLQIELVLRIVDEIHHKTHTQTREQSVHDVATCRAQARHETIPATLVQSALNT